MSRTIICNICEQMNLLGDVLNNGNNVNYQEDYGFTIIADYFPGTWN